MEKLLTNWGEISLLPGRAEVPHIAVDGHLPRRLNMTLSAHYLFVGRPAVYLDLLRPPACRWRQNGRPTRSTSRGKSPSIAASTYLVPHVGALWIAAILLAASPPQNVVPSSAVAAGLVVGAHWVAFCLAV